ncbi:MAG: hypothetical protein C0606_01530 [Hyphomicrobiales bacterium]|nr:MAG: hypothetical protein C0606_01530 [Hyphomicrobiales bacterium]
MQAATVKKGLLVLVLLGLSAILVGAIAMRVIGEEAGSNSYALLAEAFLNGKLSVERCFDGDCAVFNGQTYIIFPPVPALLVMPFVALWGADFAHFMVISLALFVLTGALWWQIFLRIGCDNALAALLVVAFLFSTPVHHVTLRGDSIWFFAQIVAVTLITLAIWSAFVWRSPIAVGLFIGLALLTRQMSILYMPFFFVLTTPADRSIFAVDRAAIIRLLKLALFPALAIAIYFAYNYVRFGDMLQTGYAYIFPAEQATDQDNFIEFRVREVGLFSKDYLLYNVLYMFLQGPHVEFAGKYLTELKGLDAGGVALFIGAPFLLFYFLAKWDRNFLFASLTILVIAGVTLFYHSNGFAQYSIQRYTLDWLPLAMLFVAVAVRNENKAILGLLVAHGMVLTIGMQGVAFLVNR